jgi:hypothetical protein
MALSQTTPSASRALHGCSSANMCPCASDETVDTSTHRLLPGGTTSGRPSSPVHMSVPPSGGEADQKAVTPCSRA